MKWMKLLIPLTLLVLCAVFPCACADQNDHNIVEESVFRMPSALRIIDESAFENTNASVVYLQDSVEYIGDYAFANMSQLSVVYIPKTTTFIGEEAFYGRDKLIIIGIKDSYAHDWAKRHGYMFLHIDVWMVERIVRSGQQDKPIYSILSVKNTDKSNLRMISRDNANAMHILDPKAKPEMPPIDYVFP